jgi:hypothetical protein
MEEEPEDMIIPRCHAVVVPMTSPAASSANVSPLRN